MRIVVHDFAGHPFQVQLCSLGFTRTRGFASRLGTHQTPKGAPYLAAGRPILAAVPSANLAARTIERSGGGVVIPPGDADGFVAARLMLQGVPDPALSLPAVHGPDDRESLHLLPEVRS